MVQDLYPPLEPFATGHLEPDGLHRVYYEQCGNPEGQPVLFLHGGPGAGCAPVHRRYFDPAHYHIVLLDQRGCGRSSPNGELERNDTWQIIGDLEAIRKRLGLDKWVLFGGSWGSTLALAYAQAHPDRIKGLILRGVFLATHDEIDWFMHHMGRFFPEAFEEFFTPFTESESDNLLDFHHQCLVDPDPAIHIPAAKLWSAFEVKCSTLIPNPEAVAQMDDPETALSLARLEAEYFRHGMFLEEGQLLADLHKISHIPAIIVQGRYDVICPPQAAYRLHKDWPGSELMMIPDAGHSASEPGIVKGLVSATEKFKNL